MFASAGEGMTITDLDGRILDVNPAFETITGYRREEVLGKNPSVLQSGRQSPEFYQDMWRTLKKTGQWRGEIWNRRKSGEVYPEWLTVSAVKDDKGKVTHYVGIFSDISSVKAAEEKADFLKHHDALTGLPNRRLLAERMSRGLARARRNDAPLVVMMIGLDRFDAINEAVGHPVGERLLESVAARLAKAVREVDTLARFSDDQFLLFAEEAVTIDQADTIARRVLGQLEESFVIAEHALGVTASIGVALYPADGESVEELVKHAELAMIESRRANLGQYRYFSRTLSEAAQDRLRLENALRGAAERGELTLHYQPQVRLRDRALVGLEALLRWNHPEWGSIAPDRFIPLAEEIGLMPAIGRWVLDEACRQMAQWRNDGLTMPRVAVNLSVQQIDRPEIAEEVRVVLARHGVAAGQLELELTESMVMRFPEAARATLQKLRGLGVELALDDFGTGYSSLACLGRLPLNRLKIDRSFVVGIGHGFSGEAIARSVISLASSLGLETVAEGVETEEQVDFLRRHGCQTGQGYWFARPMAAEALGEWLQSGPNRVQGVRDVEMQTT
ncbi:MAG: EAL domain-containing protein [Xanthomonadaceae bacterium]|nr:EAL domain-containing protein [Xanthomonadaceae bacterium]